MIQFVIRRLLTDPAAPRYVAQTQAMGTLTLEDLIARMMERDPIGGRAAAVAVLTNFFAVCQDRILEGYNLTTPLFNTKVAVKGTFDGPDDGFQQGRNTVHFSASAGIALTKALDGAHVEKLENQTRIGNATQVVDVATGNVSTTLTKGGMARLTGKRLKTGPGAGEGLFLILPNGSAVAITQKAVNNPSEVVFQVPTTGLTVGAVVQLEIRNRLNGTQELRIARLPQSLTIA